MQGDALQVTTLPLYAVLVSVQNAINQKLVRSSTVRDTSGKESGLIFASRLAQEGPKLLTTIVDGFNEGCFSCNPDIVRRFRHMCIMLHSADHTRLTPEQLRAQRLAIEDFTMHLTSYCLMHKDFLDTKDIRLYEEHCMKLMMITPLLCSDYVPASLLDRAIDAGFIRPKEWAMRHPGLIMAALASVVVIGGVWYYRR